MIKKGLIIFFALSWVFLAFLVKAQVQNGDVVLEISPKYPKAGEEVWATLSTYSTDLNNARISWIVDGETKLEGMGKKTFSFMAGSSEFGTTLEAKIETITGSLINKKITIAPADVDMLWEAYDTYTPPFYKGKTLVPVEGMVKVVAFTNIPNLAGFNYQWKLDRKNQPSASGYEKNYFIYKNSYLEDNNAVEVTVSNLFGNGIGQGLITIKPGNPKIVFYRKNLLSGVDWNNALLGNLMINPDGETIVAEPYFFYPKNFNLANVSFLWFLNGEQTETPKLKNMLSLIPTSGEGSAVIKVIINNTNTLFESVEKQLNVSF